MAETQRTDAPAESDSMREEDVREYLEVFPEHQREIELLVNGLMHDPHNVGKINALFRAAHSVKSNAAMCQIDLLVELIHPLEDLVGAIRSGTLDFTPAIGEAVLMVMDRLHQTVQYLEQNRPLEPLRLGPIASGLRAFSRANNDTSAINAQMIVELISGQPPVAQQHVPHQAETDIVCVHVSAAQQADLRFFRELSLNLERRSPFWEGRTGRLLRMAVETNELAGKPSDPVQLEAAIYMHDIGMGLLSETMLCKDGRFNELEMRELHMHPLVGAGLLERMPGWEEAAEIVSQHHEKLDGTGYPRGLKDHDIAHGAKLLAILDAFEAMTHERIDRHHKKSVMRAICELNACDYQFHRDWVKTFNQVVRQLLGTD